MCVFTHFAAGAAAGAIAPHAALVPIFALGSHIVLDMIPHFDFENMLLEVALGLAALAILLLGGVYSLSIILGGVIGALPDLENVFMKTGKIKKNSRIFPSHSGVFPHGRKAGTFNLSLQSVLSLAMLGFLIWRSA